MKGTASSGSGTASRSTSRSCDSDRPLDHRADALDELDVDPHAEDGKHDVGEHHGRIDAVRAHRLESHLGAELRLPADLEERVVLAELPVLGQRPAGLAHEPDGRPLDRLAPARAREQRLGHAASLAA